MTAQEMKNKVIEKLLHKNVIGGHTIPVDAVAGWFPTHQRGDVKDVINEMIADPNAPIKRYGGGHRDSVHLIGAKSAVEYLDQHGGNIPFGWDKYLD